MLLTGTEGMTHGYWGYNSRALRKCLMDIEDLSHRYCGYDSRVLRIWLTSTETMTHGYWGYDSRVLRIWFAGTEDISLGKPSKDRQWFIKHIVLISDSSGSRRLSKFKNVIEALFEFGLRTSNDATILGFANTEFMSHGYWAYDSQVLRIWLTDCISSRILHIVYAWWCSNLETVFPSCPFLYFRLLGKVTLVKPYTEGIC